MVIHPCGPVVVFLEPIVAVGGGGQLVISASVGVIRGSQSILH